MAQLDQLDDTGIEEAGLPTLVTADGSPEFEYSFCLLEGIDSKQVQVILIAVVDEKYLVAVPTSAWHRVASKRLLRPQTLSRASAVEVSTVKPDSREVELAQTIKIWVGFLNPAFDADLELQDPMTVPGADVVFGNSVIPFAGSLFAAANDHFAFISAESGMDVHPEDQGAPGGPNLHERVGKLESTVVSMATDLKKLLGQAADPEVADRPSAMKKTLLEATPKHRVTFAGLDPSGCCCIFCWRFSGDFDGYENYVGGCGTSSIKADGAESKDQGQVYPCRSSFRERRGGRSRRIWISNLDEPWWLYLLVNIYLSY